MAQASVPTVMTTGQYVPGILTTDTINAVGTAANTINGPLTVTGTFSAAVATPTVVNLNDAATIAVNAAAGSDQRVTIAGNRTLGNPTSPTDGQKVIFQITQGAGGPWTLSYGTAYEFSAAIPQPTLSGGAGRTDLLGFIYNAAKGTWLLVAFVPGFA
jgi:hypothetical protein